MNYHANVRVEERTSKNGRPYYMLVVTFDNGYQFETLLSKEQAFIIQLNKGHE